MRLIHRILLLTLIFSAIFPLASKGQCVFADAGPDVTVCSGGCASLTANITGTRQTNLYNVNSISYAPYAFTGGNPVLVNLDDLWSPVVNIPFCFDFYGTVYSQLVIGTNGVITFNVSQANGTCPWTITTAAPNPALPLNSIMAPFHDINPTISTSSGATSINWNVYGTAPCRTFVVNWNDVGMYGTGCSSLISSSQVVLHETTNIIDIFIKNKSVCGSWNNGAAVEGLQNATGTAATIAPGRNYPTNWSATNDAMSFRPAGMPNYTIQWLDPANNVVANTFTFQACPTQTTTYTLQVTNTGCNGIPVTVTDAVTIVVTQSNLAVTDSIVYPSCTGICDGTASIYPVNGVPPYVITWSPNVSSGTTATGLCNGNYTVTISDATGCMVVLFIFIAPSLPFTLTSANTPTSCTNNTGTSQVNINGGGAPFTYQWSTGDTTAFISGLATGPYWVIVTDSSGCSDSLPVFVSQVGLLVDTATTQLVCNGDCDATATVTPMNGVAPFTYHWVPYGGNGPMADSLCSGIFVCHITDSTGCSVSNVLSILSPQQMIATPSANQTICYGQSTIVAVSVVGGTPPYSYSWNNGLLPVASNLITPAQTTIYTVDITDANGCTTPTQSTLVKVNGTPVSAFSSIEATCPPVMINFTNLTDSALTYYWNFGDPSSGVNDTSTLFSPSHTYNVGGNYTVTLIATNAYGCADTLIIPNATHVPEGAIAALSANATFLTSLDPVVLLNNGSTHSSSYLIYFGDGDSLATTSHGPYQHAYDTLGIYKITLIAWSADGCSDTTWLTILIEEATTIFIPNAFTPNGDGKNDEFMVYGVNVRQMKFLIFNRWGELLFESDDINHAWDGTFKGDRVQEDVYVWRLLYEDNFSGWHERIGNVSVIR